MLASAFLRGRGCEVLSFTRLDDFARERLGMSGRELQSLAHVVNALVALPVLAAAFADGVLSWTQVRLLVAVARPETEARWLALAQDRTVRALEAFIAAEARARADGADSAEGGGTEPLIDACAVDRGRAAIDHARADSGSVIDGERVSSCRIRCPRWVSRLWRETVELARRVSGEPLATWRAAEAIAAEGVSAVPLRYVTAPFGIAGGTSAADPCETRSAIAEASGVDSLDWSAVVEALPADVESLLDDLPADAHALDARLRVAVSALRRIDWQLGRLLRLFFDCRLYAVLGFPSGSRYVRERLGISLRKVRSLIAVERKTWESPALMDAYRAGRISHLQALTLLPVIGERHGAAWVRRAGEVTLRRLADEVSWALDVQDTTVMWTPAAPPPADGRLVAPPAVQMRAWQDEVPSAEIAFRGPASVVAFFRATVAAWRTPATPEWCGVVGLLVHVTTEWQRAARHPDPVFARDGWRCAVPACSSRRNLHDHHIVFRSRGGDNTRDNRVTVCAWHHLRGIHAGRLRASGHAPDDVHWELGVRADGAPLARFRGDRYEIVEVGGVSQAA